MAICHLQSPLSSALCVQTFIFGEGASCQYQNNNRRISFEEKTYFLILFFHYLTRLLFLHSSLSPCIFSSLSSPPLNRFDRQTVEEFLFPPPSLFSNSDISPLLFSPSFDSSCGNYQGGFLPPLNHPSSLQRAVGKGGCRSNPTFFFGVGGGRREEVVVEKEDLTEGGARRNVIV